MRETEKRKEGEGQRQAQETNKKKEKKRGVIKTVKQNKGSTNTPRSNEL